MEVVAKSNSKGMYSWWWDSHNTPKNSKWLHDNLADMDSNVKKMIKVLEEDADSFARRAEMYYHKRPELMNLVEEFYRAYRALAERYNHATGVIHKAHQTIAEALPNQVPIIFGDPQTPEMLPPIQDRVDPDEGASKVEAETDKEAALVQYLKTISNLEERLSKAEEKCTVLERSNQNLHSELDGLLEKLRIQSQKLTEKQTELAKLWSRVQEEHLRFQEAETKFQTLQELHSQSQEELNNLAVELQTRSRIMNDMEMHQEIQKAKVENKDLNLSSVASVKSLQEDVSSLKETIQKLEVEVESRVDRESQAATFVCDKEISALHETLITATTHEQAEACNNLEKLKRSQAVVLLNEGIKSLEDYVFVDREDKLSKVADSNDEFPKLEDMCLRIKAIAEAIMKKEKLLMLDNSNAYSMLEEALKQVKELKTGGGRSMRKQEGGTGKTRKQSHELEIITKDIVFDQTSDGSSYEMVSKKGNLEFDNHSFFELKPVKTETTMKAKGKSLSEESLTVDKLEIFDGFMDPNIEVNKRKVLERLRSDLQKLENLQITVKDLKHKVETEDEYATIKGQVGEAEEAIEKLFNVNQKLTRKAESEKIGRVSEHARRGSEKIGRLQLEIQRIQFMLMKLQGEKVNRVRSKISDTSSKVLLRDYIYGGSRSVTMKKKTTKKRSAFCGCAQQPPSP